MSGESTSWPNCILMKRLISLCVASVLVFPVAVNAQSLSKQVQKEQTEQQKQRKAQRKLNEKELNQKATKEARKEAKRLTKDGWTVTPGTLPLEKQLDRTYLMQYQFSADNEPAYIMAEGMSIGGSYDAAKIQALELAKMNLVSQLQSDITAIVENTVANDQLIGEEVSSVTRSVMASKNVMAQKLGRLQPVMECYRTKSNGNKEVLVRVAYDRREAMNLAKDSVRNDLLSRGDSLHRRINAILPDAQ